MGAKPEVQIWDILRRKIFPKFEDNSCIIRIDENAPVLPDILKDEVNQNWQRFCLENRFAKDNPVPYLASYEVIDGNLHIVTQKRGFRYTHAFNRNPTFHKRVEELLRYNLMTLSTFCTLITKDNKILFGTKKNQFNQISGFAGFPNIKEDAIEVDRHLYLDIHKTLKNRMRPEIGDLVEKITNIELTALVYLDTPGLRGPHLHFTTNIDATAEEAQKSFRESSQFERQLYIVDYTPDKIADFFKKVYAEGKEMSKYCLGGMYAEIKVLFGQKEADKIMKTIKGFSIDAAEKDPLLNGQIKDRRDIWF